MPSCQDTLPYSSNHFSNYLPTASALSEHRDVLHWRESVCSPSGEIPLTPPDTPPDCAPLNLSAMDDLTFFPPVLPEDYWYQPNESPLELTFDDHDLALPSQMPYGPGTNGQSLSLPGCCDETDGHVDAGLSPVLTYGSHSTESYHCPSEPDFTALLNASSCHEPDTDFSTSGSFPESHNRAVLPSSGPEVINHNPSFDPWLSGTGPSQLADPYGPHITLDRPQNLLPKAMNPQMSISHDRFPDQRPDLAPACSSDFPHQRAISRSVFRSLQPAPGVNGSSGPYMITPGQSMFNGFVHGNQVSCHDVPAQDTAGFRASSGYPEHELNRSLAGGLSSLTGERASSALRPSGDYVELSHNHSSVSQHLVARGSKPHLTHDNGEAASPSDPDENRYRVHPLYSEKPGADGLYHCPFRNKTNCSHVPAKLKCNYDKYLDSHIKPFRCKQKQCQDHPSFSSTACLLRHEREAHGMHGHGERPHRCHYPDCARASIGFPRKFNLYDHMKRIHGHPSGSSEDARPPSKEKNRKRRAGSGSSEQESSRRGSSSHTSQSDSVMIQMPLRVQPAQNPSLSATWVLSDGHRMRSQPVFVSPGSNLNADYDHPMQDVYVDSHPRRMRHR